MTSVTRPRAPRLQNFRTDGRLFPSRGSRGGEWIHRRPGRARPRAGVPASAYGVSQVDSEQHRPRASSAAPEPGRRSSTIADNTYNAAHLLVLEGLEAV